jgi:hypothetical protein
LKHISLAIAAATLATTGSAQAITTTFTLDATVKGLTSIQASQNGINLTIGNFSTGPRAGGDIDGLAVYCVGGSAGPCQHGVYEGYTSFTMTFDQPVKLLSYNISYLESALDASTTYAQGALQSVETYSGSLGTKLFVNQFIAAANVPITVTTTDDNNDGLAQINAFTVEQVVSPASSAVPGPLPLVGAAAAFGWSRRLRGRIRDGQPRG